MQFKAYQQKRNMILDLGKLKLFKSGRGSFPPPRSPAPPPPSPATWPRAWIFTIKLASVIKRI